jgi:hypothetical protein
MKLFDWIVEKLLLARCQCVDCPRKWWRGKGEGAMCDECQQEKKS